MGLPCSNLPYFCETSSGQETQCFNKTLLDRKKQRASPTVWVNPASTLPTKRHPGGESMVYRTDETENVSLVEFLHAAAAGRQLVYLKWDSEP